MSSCGQGNVAADKGVEGVAEHRLRQLAHSRDVNQRLDRRVAQVALAGLADVHGQVAHPLEVGVDLDGGDDHAQVGGHRLVQGQQLETAVVQLDVQVVDGLIAGQYGLERRTVAVHQAAQRFAHPFLGQAAHGQQALLERVELVLEVSKHAFH